jgi:hypothetical protein
MRVAIGWRVSTAPAERSHMVLILVILFTWLAIAGFTVILCKAAARGDAERERAIREPVDGRRVAPGLVVWDPACVEIRTRRAVRPRRVSRRREPAAG